MTKKDNEIIDTRAVDFKDSAIWHLDRLPKSVEGFEDLSSLFYATCRSRGAARLDLDEAALLFKAVKSLGNPRCLEIGRCKGGSTLIMAAAGGYVYSVDTRSIHDAEFRTVLEHTGLTDRVELLVGDANRVDIPGPFDFIFIDGDHSYEGVKKDHERWSPRLRVGGLLAFHDMGKARQYASQQEGVRLLRDEILSHQGDEFQVAATAGSLVVFERRDRGKNGVRGNVSY